MCASIRPTPYLATIVAILIASTARALEVTLSTVPAPVYKNRDSGRTNSESWMFNLVVADAKNRKDRRRLSTQFHYQLQDGAELFRAVSLPVKFDNLQGTDLGRGNYITPH